MSLLIKVCGVTTPEDAELAARAGADAIGINFWSGSRRFIGDAAAEVIAAIPAGVLKFGVFVNAPVDEILRAADDHRLDRVQLHGDERPEDFRAIPRKLLVRAVRVRGRDSLRELSMWAADLFLLDAFTASYGGGGVTAPWTDIAAHHSGAPAEPPIARAPFLLAGGLHPGNVAAAIHATSPAGVDVASGVETASGRKSERLVREFVAAARAAARKATVID